MKKLFLVGLIWFLLTGIGAAQGFDFTLDAGSKSISAGAHYRKDMNSGYLITGISGVYTDDDRTEYKWGTIRVAVGNDTIVKGLRCEMGLKGILGDAEDGVRESDVGALAFTIYGGYMIPQSAGPVTFEVFSELTYAPELLCFRDTESYLEGTLGLGIHLIKTATLSLTYSVYDVDLENGPGDWALDEEVVRAGIHMRF